jgi:hypothetical protein
MGMIRLQYGLLVAMLALASACADQNYSLVILQNQAPGGDCSLSTDPTMFISHGVDDLNLGGYVLTPLIQSNLIERDNAPSATNIVLKGATAEIQAVDSDDSRATVSALSEVTGRMRYFAGTLTPGATIVVHVEIIDDAQAAALLSTLQPGQSVEVLVKVIVLGEVAGDSISSDPFYYPITLTNGGSSGGFINLGQCDALPEGFVGEDTTCFGTGQDGRGVECCTRSGVLVCPAEGPAPTTP